MSNKEMVVKVLNKFSCMTSLQIKSAVFREFGVIISPQSAAGVLRNYIAYGMAASSKNSYNKNVYWLTECGKEKLCK